MQNVRFVCVLTTVLVCAMGPAALSAQPADGIYEGATSQGREISVTVSNGNVTSAIDVGQPPARPSP